jgi:hypothetical protein
MAGTSVRREETTASNKALQLTSAERIERSQLNAGVLRTIEWN